MRCSINEELSDLYLKLKESGELENIFHLEDIRQIVETNISKDKVMQLLTNSRFLKLVCTEYNIDFLSACITFGCNNPEANKLLEKYLEESYDALSNHKAK